jgi:hypothetical protein
MHKIWLEMYKTERYPGKVFNKVMCFRQVFQKRVEHINPCVKAVTHTSRRNLANNYSSMRRITPDIHYKVLIFKYNIMVRMCLQVVATALENNILWSVSIKNALYTTINERDTLARIAVCYAVQPGLSYINIFNHGCTNHNDTWMLLRLRGVFLFGMI